MTISELGLYAAVEKRAITQLDRISRRILAHQRSLRLESLPPRNVAAPEFCSMLPRPWETETTAGDINYRLSFCALRKTSLDTPSLTKFRLVAQAAEGQRH
jgi:hypothetical protein